MGRTREVRTLLLTGGTGTLGRAIVEHGVGWHILAVTNDEYQWYEMRRDHPEVETVLCDIRNFAGMEALFFKGIDAVVHAAALKHVPMGEQQPMDTVAVNVEGTENVVRLCRYHHVAKAVYISTDKAVEPINVYGATKFIGERIFLSYGYSVCRFGNFWGSRGSVIETWGKQAQGGTITITDPLATRYFIQPCDAARFVLDKLEEYEPTQVWIPKMRKWSVGRLAQHIAPDAKWNVIGLQPGEKKHEVLS